MKETATMEELSADGLGLGGADVGEVKDPRLSIIIVNWNTRDMLAACLGSIQTRLEGVVTHEVIVVDNNSADGSAEMVRSGFPWVKLLESGENLGFVGGNNLATRLARGRILLLLNSDTVLLDSHITKIINYLDENPDVGVVIGKVLNVDGSFQRPFRRFPDFRTALANLTVNLIVTMPFLIIEDYNLRRLDEDQEHDVDWVVGCYLFARRDLLNDGKIFNEKIFMFMEDTLLCHEAREKGYRVVYLPVAPITHYGRASTSKVLPRAIRASFDSSRVYIDKVYGGAAATVFALGVKLCWWLFAAGFAVLGTVPHPKIRKKRDLFVALITGAERC